MVALVNVPLIATEPFEFLTVMEPPEQVQFQWYVLAVNNVIAQVNAADWVVPPRVTPWTVTLCPVCLAAVSVPPDPVMVPLVALALVRTLVFAGAVKGVASATTQAHVNTVFVLRICFNLARMN
jgi:hypothetical protein